MKLSTVEAAGAVLKNMCRKLWDRWSSKLLKQLEESTQGTWQPLHNLIFLHVYVIKYFGFLKRSLSIQVWWLFWIVWWLFLMLPCQTSGFEFPKDMTYVDWTKCSATTQHLHCHRPKWRKWVLEAEVKLSTQFPRRRWDCTGSHFKPMHTLGGKDSGYEHKVAHLKLQLMILCLLLSFVGPFF